MTKYVWLRKNVAEPRGEPSEFINNIGELVKNDDFTIAIQNGGHTERFLDVRIFE